MIKKMTKYSFVLFHREAAPFMEHLQTLGLMDITRRDKAIDSRSKELYDLMARYDNAILNLNTLLKDKELRKKDKGRIEVETGALLSLTEEKTRLKGELEKTLADLKAELREAHKWGEFSRNDLERLGALGYNLHFYQCNKKLFKEQWKAEYNLAILNRQESSIYFIILENDGPEYRFPLAEAKFPERPASMIEEEIGQTEKKMEQNCSELLVLGEYTGELARQRETVATGFVAVVLTRQMAFILTGQKEKSFSAKQLSESFIFWSEHGKIVRP